MCINVRVILIFLSLSSTAGKLRHTAHGTETAVFSFDSIYLGPAVRYKERDAFILEITISSSWMIIKII
jgi:hypothetical protein